MASKIKNEENIGEFYDSEDIIHHESIQRVKL